MTYSLKNETKMVTYESREYSKTLMGDGTSVR